MKIKTYEDLLTHKISDLFNAEEQLVEMLPKIAKEVDNKELKEVLKEHLQQTKEQVKRLKSVAKELGIDVKDEKCKGMEGILKEGEKALKETENEVLKNVVAIAESRKVEHYEMSGYTSLLQLLNKPEHKKAIELLNETLAEEEEADKKLMKIAIKI